MSYSRIEEIEPEILKALKDYIEKRSMEGGMDLEIKSIDDIIDYIKEAGGSEEDVDRNFIYCHYSVDIGDYIFRATGSSYRKDGGVCDEEMSNYIEIDEKAKDAIITNISTEDKVVLDLPKEYDEWILILLKRGLMEHQTSYQNMIPVPKQVESFIKEAAKDLM